MGLASRKPNSNDPPKKSSNPWGSQNPMYDNIAVLINGDGKRCCVCKRVVINIHLKYKEGLPYCPDHFSEGEKNRLPTKEEQDFFQMATDGLFPIIEPMPAKQKKRKKPSK